MGRVESGVAAVVLPDDPPTPPVACATLRHRLDGGPALVHAASAWRWLRPPAPAHAPPTLAKPLFVRSLVARDSARIQSTAPEHCWSVATMTSHNTGIVLASSSASPSGSAIRSTPTRQVAPAPCASPRATPDTPAALPSCRAPPRSPVPVLRAVSRRSPAQSLARTWPSSPILS